MRNQKIKESYDRIRLPSGAEERVQKKINAALPRPMRECRVILQPRRNFRRKTLAAAAVLVLFLLAALGVERVRGAENVPQLSPAEPESVQAAAPSQKNQKYYPGDAYYLEKFAEVLENYRTVLTEEADEEKCKTLDVSPLCREFYGLNALHRLGYCLTDLNMDGVPELLIGCTDEESEYRNVILDLYRLGAENEPRKLGESRQNEYCYDCGGGYIRVEVHWIGEDAKEIMSSWIVYDLSGFKALVGELTMTAAGESSLSFPAQPLENGYLTSREIVEVPMTREEAEAWLIRYCKTSVVHSYIPFDPAEP